MRACPRCGRTFANRNQTHTCAPLGSLDDHVARCEPQVRATFDAVLDVVRGLGPFEVLPERTRIALHRRTSFAAFAARRRWLDAGRRGRRGDVVVARSVRRGRAAPPTVGPRPRPR